eukprot:TRINITY_DN7215_c0_g1_i3.p1 TRINITY_DN7215_c0_g1~~TRINITY_DN7215_c0_g1_i3.p1  ORF type:complete len:183 (-),score=39.91 TRINITY_DN7215_c0_g1_i3:364-912(-)
MYSNLCKKIQLRTWSAILMQSVPITQKTTDQQWESREKSWKMPITSKPISEPKKIDVQPKKQKLSLEQPQKQDQKQDALNSPEKQEKGVLKSLINFDDSSEKKKQQKIEQNEEEVLMKDDDKIVQIESTMNDEQKQNEGQEIKVRENQQKQEENLDQIAAALEKNRKLRERLGMKPREDTKL